MNTVVPSVSPARARAAGRDRRPGFTLVELLVTVVIIGVLSSLLLTGLLAARQSQRDAKTRATIRKLSEVVLPYYEEYEMRRPSLPPLTSKLSTAAFKELRRIALRRLMTQELPERSNEVPERSNEVLVSGTYQIKRVGDVASTPDLMILGGLKLAEVTPANRRYISIVDAARKAWSDAGKTGFVADSAELLHMIVTRGPVADPDVVAHFRPDEVADVDRDGLPEFIDAWLRPIQFLRWPVGFASPVQPIDGSQGGIDPVVSEKGHRLVPLIFSAGRDGGYDVAPNPDLNYAENNYDPFHYAASISSTTQVNCYEPRPLRGAVVMRPAPVPAGLAVTRPTTFVARRLGIDLTTMGDEFQAVGSERDVDGEGSSNPNKVIESLDNIHNHDLTR